MSNATMQLSEELNQVLKNKQARGDIWSPNGTGDFKSDTTLHGEAIFAGLVNSGPPVVRTVPEDIFVINFLPYFSGEKNIADNLNLLNQWFEICGTATQEVAVVDPRGKELYRVPPYFDGKSIETRSTSRAQGLGTIMEEYKLRKNVLPAMGESYLNKVLGPKLNDMIHEGVSPNQQRWLDIFKRYGIKPKAAAGVPVEETVKPVSGLDDVIYD